MEMTPIPEDSAISGIPETQSVSIAGRRSANEGRSLFVAVAFLQRVRLHFSAFVYTSLFYLACCEFLSEQRRIFAL